MAVLFRLQGCDLCVEIVVIHQRAAAGVRKDVGDLRRHQPPVHRHQHGADLGDGEIGFNEFNAVFKQHANAIPRRYALREQRIGNAIGALVELSKTEASVAFKLDEGFACGTDIGPLAQQQAYVGVCHEISKKKRYSGAIKCL